MGMQSSVQNGSSTGIRAEGKGAEGSLTGMKAKGRGQPYRYEGKRQRAASLV